MAKCERMNEKRWNNKLALDFRIMAQRVQCTQ